MTPTNQNTPERIASVEAKRRDKALREAFCDPREARDVQITIKHRETGLTIILPEGLGRSQHKRVQAGLDAIEYLLAL